MFYTIPQIAKKMNATGETVRRWVKQGHLAAHQIGSASTRKHLTYRISEEDFRQFLASTKESHE